MSYLIWLQVSTKVSKLTGLFSLRAQGKQVHIGIKSVRGPRPMPFFTKGSCLCKRHDQSMVLFEESIIWRKVFSLLSFWNSNSISSDLWNGAWKIFISLWNLTFTRIKWVISSSTYLHFLLEKLVRNIYDDILIFQRFYLDIKTYDSISFISCCSSKIFLQSNLRKKEFYPGTSWFRTLLH